MDKKCDLSFCGIVKSPIEMLNIFSYAMPIEDVVEKFCLLNKKSIRCIRIFDIVFQKMFNPEIYTMKFDFVKELENIHAGNVTSMLVLQDKLFSCCMSGVIIRWNTETYEAEAKLEIEGGFKCMTLLERKESPLIIAGVRDSIVYVDPFKLEIVKTLESVHVAHLHQIVGLNKFENEYFVSQDCYSAIKVFHVDSGECCISIESTGCQLNDHVTNTLIELENPYVELFNSGLKLREEDDSEIFKEESSHQSEMEEEQYAMIAVSVPFKSGCALAIYKLDPISKTHSIVKVLNKKGPKISKGFSLLQLKGGIVAYSNYGEIEIINLWEDFKVLKKSINSEDPVRKMLLVNKRRRTNVLKEHPLGSFNLMSVGYRSELNLWNVDFKQAGEAMEKAEASRELKHKKSVLDVVKIGDQIVTSSVDSSIHLYDAVYRY